MGQQQLKFFAFIELKDCNSHMGCGSHNKSFKKIK